jgi:hypothetical protein
MQGLGDEGWGLRSATISADISGIPVPEPYTILLFIIGVAGLVASRIDRAKSIN